MLTLNLANIAEYSCAKIFSYRQAIGPTSHGETYYGRRDLTGREHKLEKVAQQLTNEKTSFRKRIQNHKCRDVNGSGYSTRVVTIYTINKNYKEYYLLIFSIPHITSHISPYR
jgi:hypothetical protein